MNKQFTEGIGEAVAKRTILREKAPGYWETWDDVANRVAQGNSLLSRGDLDEYRDLYKELRKGRILMSGRHLQHGDDDQTYKTIEVFTNCSTADFSALSFYLKLNGSGVGRLYNRDCLYVDWGSRPRVFVHLDADHPDTFAEECTKSKEFQDKCVVFKVKDSREGWAEAVDFWERGMDSCLDLCIDFSDVRPKGSPIKGMQNRPSSGPVPLMMALLRASEIARGKDSNWLKTLKIDHELAACVEMGGVRRSAGMAGMHWQEPGIFEFIWSKSKGGLWSANHSICVDAEFWRQESPLAQEVFRQATEASYRGGPEGLGKGEPGFINYDKLKGNVNA